MSISDALRRFSSTIVLMCIFAVVAAALIPGGVYAGILLVCLAVGAVLYYAPVQYRTRYLSVCLIAAVLVGFVLIRTLTV